MLKFLIRQKGEVLNGNRALTLKAVLKCLKDEYVPISVLQAIVHYNGYTRHLSESFSRIQRHMGAGSSFLSFSRAKA